MRQHCQKLSVHEKLSGAHFVFPGESSLAVRAYYPADLQRLENASSVANADVYNQRKDKAKLLEIVHEGNEADIDGVATFASHFRLALVLFVLPKDVQQAQLNRIDSFTNRSMRLLESQSTSTAIRVMIVSDTHQAIKVITHLADARMPAATEVKKAFFERHDPCAMDHSTVSREAIRSWAMTDAMGLTEKDARLLCSLMPNIRSIACADAKGLESIALDTRTQQKIMDFFRSNGATRFEDGSDDHMTPYDSRIDMVSDPFHTEEESLRHLAPTDGSMFVQDFNPLPQHGIPNTYDYERTPNHQQHFIRHPVGPMGHSMASSTYSMPSSNTYEQLYDHRNSGATHIQYPRMHRPVSHANYGYGPQSIGDPYHPHQQQYHGSFARNPSSVAMSHADTHHAYNTAPFGGHMSFAADRRPTSYAEYGATRVSGPTPMGAQYGRSEPQSRRSSSLTRYM